MTGNGITSRLDTAQKDGGSTGHPVGLNRRKNLTIKRSLQVGITLVVMYHSIASGASTSPSQGLQEFLSSPPLGASKDGVAVIRNFTSGGFGSRGADIRKEYTKKDIPPKGVVPVHSEAPISVKEMFGSFPKDQSGYREYRLQQELFVQQGDVSSVPKTPDFIRKLVNAFSGVGDCAPCVLSAENSAVVADAQVIDNILTGNIACLHREQGAWKVRAILDLR